MKDNIIYSIFFIFFIGLQLFIFLGCNPAKRMEKIKAKDYKKIERIKERSPELFEQQTLIDTFVKENIKTVVVKERVDEAELIRKSKKIDTIQVDGKATSQSVIIERIVTKTDTVLKFKFRTIIKPDTLYYFCTDTLYKEVVKEQVIVPKRLKNAKLIGFASTLIALALILILLRKRTQKN